MINSRLLVDMVSDFAHIADQPEDSQDTSLQKSLMMSASIMFILAGMAWGIIYLIHGQFLAAAIPYGYSLISVLTLFLFGLTGRFHLYRYSQFLLLLLFPFLLATVLGGFSNSSVVILWAVVSPLGALIFSPPRYAYRWQLAYVLLLVLSGVLQPLLERRAGIPPSLLTTMYVLNIGIVTSMVFVLFFYFVQKKNQVMEMLRVEREKSERLLLNVLPKEIAPALKEEGCIVASSCPSASVLFADMVSFTRLSVEMTPEEMVELLNEIFSHFDLLVDRYGVEKIRTIGDNYMVAAGVPVEREDHVVALANMALEMKDYIHSFPSRGKQKIDFRFGLHTGPLVAGVIGRQKFHYDVWGDTVNVASRMESEGISGRIQVTAEVHRLIDDQFICEPRGVVDIKGKGPMETWFIEGRKADVRIL